MAKQSKWWKWAPLALILSSSTGLVAQCECAPLNWTVSAEAIWWAPAQTDLSFAENGFVEPNVGFQSVAVIEDLRNDFFRTKHGWGFRLGYEYQGSAWTFRTRYLWLETERLASSIRGEGPNDALSSPLFPGLGLQVTTFDRIDGTLDTIYNLVDASLWRRVIEYNCTVVHFGIKFNAFYVRDRTAVKGVGVQLLEDTPLEISGNFRFENQYVGAVAGPSGSFSLDLTCGFALFGEIMVPAGVVYRRARIDTASAVVTPPAPPFPPFYSDLRLPVRIQARPCFEQGVQGTLLLTYENRCGCLGFSGRFGYEAHVYTFNAFAGPLLGFAITY